MKLIIILFFINVLFSLPRFSIETGTSCMNCHVNPSGGGMRNDYGSSIYSLDELPLKRLIKNADDMWDGYISDNFQIGADFRIQHFNDGNDSKLFPMQSDFYANLKISKNTDVYMKIDTSPFSKNEFFILFKNVFKKTWIKIGKTLPAYGLRLDDHTSFIRGGNRTSLVDTVYSSNDYIVEHNDHTHNLSSNEYIIFNNIDKGLFFDPLSIAHPISIESGIKISDNVRLNVSLSNGFIKSDEKEMLNYSTTLNYIKDFEDVSFMSGFSYLDEKNVISKGVFGGFSINKFTFSFELDETKNWLDSFESRAGYSQLVYRPIQGLHIVGKYDFFDRHIGYSSGFIERYSAGFEIYPLSILEIKVQARQNKIDLGLPFYAKDLKNEYLIQVHTWF